MAAAAGLEEASELSLSPSESLVDQVRCMPVALARLSSDAAAARRWRRRRLSLSAPCPPLAPCSRPAAATAPLPAALHASLAVRRSSGRRQASRPPRNNAARLALLVALVPPRLSVALHPPAPQNSAPLPWMQAPSVKQCAKQINMRLMQTQAPQVGAGALAARRSCAFAKCRRRRPQLAQHKRCSSISLTPQAKQSQHLYETHSTSPHRTALHLAALHFTSPHCTAPAGGV